MSDEAAELSNRAVRTGSTGRSREAAGGGDDEARRTSPEGERRTRPSPPAQAPRGGSAGVDGTAARAQPGEGERYSISERIDLAWHTRLYQRKPGEPTHRRLHVFAVDPGMACRDGGVCVVEVPYERLEPGPKGSVLEVSNRGENGESWSAADLEHPHVTMRDGYAPSLSDSRFHQQMVYAVAMKTYDNFRVALGRNVSWAFSRREGDGDDARNRLLLRPHGPAEEPNAWYDRGAGEIVFGHFTARRSTPMLRKGTGRVFTCVCDDVVAHEMSHALLDGLRAHFTEPTHPDVPAFHEAFADLVAVFQRFAMEDVVRSAIGKARGKLAGAHVLIDIGQELGEALEGEGRALRTLLSEGSADEMAPLSDLAGAHERGQRLARSVFCAFETIYEQRARRYVKLATGGSGELPPGELASGLHDALVGEIGKVARQFLTICIRAIDYCPPVDVRFGDYLRALITADHDVVPEDRLGYREAIIRAFGEHGLYGECTRSMSEDELLWRPPRWPIERLEGLSFSRMAFDGDPARPVSQAEMRRQAGVLGRCVTERRHAREFGLVSPGTDAFRRGGYELPRIESVRSARRVGPDREVSFDTVAEVVQRRRVPLPDGRSFVFFGGSTVILGPRGEVRFVVRKRVDDEEGRMREQYEFMRGERGRRLWVRSGARYVPAPDLARHLCRPEASAGRSDEPCSGR